MFFGKRVLVKTALNPYSGYGNDGIGLVTALQEAGYDVALVPTVVVAPLPENVALLLTKMIQPPYDFVLNHADPDGLGLSYGERNSAPLTIAWTMWEFLGLGESGEHCASVDGVNLPLRDRLKTYNLIMPYDEVSRTALTPYLSEQHTVKKLQGGYFAEGWKASPMLRDWSDPFRFCMVGQLHARKNPWVAVKAFDMLKQKYGDDFNAELHLKTNIRTLHPKMEERYPGLKIHYAAWSKQQLKDFYLFCHCYLAPSWGEGKNLPAIEAQSTGMPVIANDFGGHAEWMSPEYTYSVKYTIEEHQPGMGSARTDVDDLAEKMWHVYTNRGEAKQKGVIASQVVPAMMDWSKVIERLTAIVEDVSK